MSLKGAHGNVLRGRGISTAHRARLARCYTARVATAGGTRLARRAGP